MASIREVYFAMLTHAYDNAGTDSAINLVINQRGVDVVNHRFGDTPQADQERGQANLYSIPVISLVDDDAMDAGSARVEILGDDAWEPEVLFLWGITRDTVPRRVVPLAIETDIGRSLSTNDPGAFPSMPIRSVQAGDAAMEIRRLLLVLITDGSIVNGMIESDDGTDNRIALQIVANNELVVQHVIPDTPQDDLEPLQANLYWIPVIVPFTRDSLDIGAIRLSIDGTDMWLPQSLSLFGLDYYDTSPDQIVPLVHLDPWELGALSTDSGEGSAEVILPLLPPPAPDVQPPVIVAAPTD
jgi:hypothetical protein